MIARRTSRRIVGAIALFLLSAAVLCSSAAPLVAEEPQAAVRDFNTAARLQNLGNYERAAQRWAEFLKEFPQSERLADVQNHLAICQLQLKQFADAEKTLQTLMQKHPNFKQLDAAHYNLGMAQYQRGQAEKNNDLIKQSAQTLSQMADKHKQSRLAPKALYFQAEALYTAGEKDGAIATYRKLTSEHAQSSLAPQAWYFLGVTQQEQGRSDEAAKTYADFLAKGEYAKHELADEIRLRRAMILHEAQSFAEAEALFAEVAKQQEGKLADFALLRQGQCQLAAGKADQAATTLADLAKHFPKSAYLPTSQLALGKAQFQLEKWEEARKSLDAASKAQQIPPAESAEATYWLARTLLKQSKADEAEKLLAAATQKFAQTEFSPYLKLARADALYEKEQTRQQAQAAYAEFVAQHGDHPLAAQARYMVAYVSLAAKNYPAAREAADVFLADPKLQKDELAPEMLFIAGESRLLDEARNNDSIKQAQQRFEQLASGHTDHPRAPRARLRVAACLAQLEQHQQVIAQLEKSLGQLKEPADKADAQWMIGNARAGLNQHAEAVAAFDEAVKADPQGPLTDDAHLGAAQSLLALNQPDQARGRLQTLVQQFADGPLRTQAEYQLGEIAAQQNKHDEAKQRFEQVISRAGDSDWGPRARFALASVCLQSGDAGKAVEHLNQLLASQPAEQLHADATLLRGLAHRQQGKFNEAVTDLSAYLAGKPQEDRIADARYELALAQAGQKKHAEAAATLRDLLAKYGESEKAEIYRYELAHALSDANQPPESAAAFRELAEKHPKGRFAGESWFRVGAEHERLAETLDGDARTPHWTAAAEAFDKGIKAITENPQPQSEPLAEKLAYKLGDMQFRLGKYDAAAVTLLASIGRQPEGELAGLSKFLAGESLFRQNKFQEALPLFVDVAQKKIAPYEAQALYRAATSAAELNDHQSSEKHFTVLLNQHPKFEQAADARYGLAVAIHKRGDFAAAEKLLEQITDETETETAAKARFLIGEIAFGRRQFDTAIEHFIETGGYPYSHWQGMARLETARCLNELKQTAKAVGELEAMLKQHPDHPRAEDAKRLLAEWKK